MSECASEGEREKKWCSQITVTSVGIPHMVVSLSVVDAMRGTHVDDDDDRERLKEAEPTCRSSSSSSRDFFSYFYYYEVHTQNHNIPCKCKKDKN